VDDPTADLDRLGNEIAELSAHIQAATYQLLVLIREFDARDGWGTGFRSSAHWLNWRTGLDLGAVREKVRVAHALAGGRSQPQPRGASLGDVGASPLPPVVGSHQYATNPNGGG